MEGRPPSAGSKTDATEHGPPEEKARLAREKAEAELAELQTRIGPLQKEINQLTRQFWVGKNQVVAQNYGAHIKGHRALRRQQVVFRGDLPCERRAHERGRSAEVVQQQTRGQVCAVGARRAAACGLGLYVGGGALVSRFRGRFL